MIPTILRTEGDNTLACWPMIDDAPQVRSVEVDCGETVVYVSDAPAYPVALFLEFNSPYQPGDTVKLPCGTCGGEGEKPAGKTLVFAGEEYPMTVSCDCTNGHREYIVESLEGLKRAGEIFESFAPDNFDACPDSLDGLTYGEYLCLGWLREKG